MYHESTRDMSERERQELLESLRFSSPVSAGHTLKWGAMWAAVFVASTVLGIVLLSSDKSHVVLVALPLFVTVLASVVSFCGFFVIVSNYFNWRKRTRDFHHQSDSLIRSALEHGKVLSKRVTAQSVITIEEFEDEGAGYIFDVGDGKSLILKGQQYFPVQEDMPWPSSEFEIIRSADAGVWVGIFSSGKPLAPSRVVKMEDCNNDFFWADMEEVVQGTPDEVLATILRRTGE